MSDLQIRFGDRPGEPELASAPFPTQDGKVVQWGVIIIALLVLGFTAPLVQTPWGAGSYAAGFAFLVLAVVANLVDRADFQPSIVRVAPSVEASQGLRFTPPGRRIGVPIAMISLMFLWGLYAAFLAFVIWLIQGQLSLWEVPLSIIIAIAGGVWAVVWIVRLLVQHLKQAPGLTIKPEGITAAWGGRIQHVSWEQLRRATIVPHKRFGPKLAILDDEGLSVLEIRARGLGSDPMVVAALIHYYRDHPEDRHLLTQPEAAFEKFRVGIAAAVRDIDDDRFRGPE